MRRRWVWIAAAAVVVLAIAGGLLRGSTPARSRTRSSASSTQLPTTTTRPKPPPKPTAPEAAVPWPTYGYDEQRTRFAADSPLRPPFRHVVALPGAHPPRVPAGDRLREPLRPGRARARRRARREDREGRSGRSATTRASRPRRPSWRRVVYFAMMNPCAEPHDTAQGLVVALAAKTGKELWRFKLGAAESSPVVVRGIALRRVARRQALRAQRAHREAALVVHGRRRDQGRRRLCGPQGLLRGLRRQRLRARRAHRQAGLEGGRGELARARPRTVLREPGDRLRPRVHRRHRRRRVRVRRRHRGAPLGAGDRARTSTARPRSGTGRSTSAPTTTASTRSTPRRARCAGRSRPTARSRGRRP